MTDSVPATVTTVLGLAALAFAAQVAAVVVVAAVAGGSPAWRYRALGSLPAPLRGVVGATAVGLGVLLGDPAGAQPPEPPPATFTLRSLDDPLPPPAPPGPEPEPAAGRQPGADGRPAATMIGPHHGPTSWTVRPGDHLWSIAEAVLASAGRPTDDAAVAPFWRAVVGANPQLADPDLVLPGDVVAVPALP